MQLKTQFHNFLKIHSDNSVHNCINIDNELIQNIHKFYKQKCEKHSVAIRPPSYLNEGCNNSVELSALSKTFDINNICVSLKLKLKVKNRNGKEKQNDCLYFDINPGGIMSKNQKNFFYQYKYTSEKNDEYFENLPREHKMKY
ncbi:hypothetical protein PMLGA01_080032200, partial [Plasmodium malariae]